MAASMSNRRKPENSQGEKPREPRDHLYPQQGRNRQKQLPGQAVTRTPSLLPPASRPKPASIQQQKPATRRRPHLQAGSEISHQRLKLRAAQGSLSQSSNVVRGRRRRAIPKTPAAEPFKALLNLRSRQQERNRPPIAATVTSVPSQVRAIEARRLNQSRNSQPSQTQKNRLNRHPQKRPTGPLVHIIRLLIVGIGIGTIAGTVLSALNPTSHASVKTKDPVKSQIQESPNSLSGARPLPLAQEMSPLKAQIQTLVAQNPSLQPGIFIVDLDTGAYIDLDGNSTFSAASTIKLPILVAFFQDVDKGKIRLDELLTMKPEMIAGGSGDLQYKKPGTQYTALEVAKKMITISDNTATNMLIERLGGAEVLDQRFRSWGLTTTAIRNRLPDVEGTNTTSPRELASLMSIVHQGELVSLQSRDRILDIMQQTVTNSMLPKGLGAGAIIAHKTGTIGSLLADVGLVDMPTGKRYIVTVMVKRPHNDASAEELIRQISRTTYDYLSQPLTIPSTNTMPSGSPPTLTSVLTSENSVNLSD